MIVAGPSGRFEVAVEALRHAAAAERWPGRHTTSTPTRRPPCVAWGLDAFVVDGRIANPGGARQAPGGARLAGPALRARPALSRADVNAWLREHIDDVAAGRRYLVDEGFLDRAGGEYCVPATRCGSTIRGPTGHRFAPV